MIILIAAIAKNRIIGSDNTLIWHLPEDLKRFKKLTTGKRVVMGRKTFQSIGRPLPGRANVVITRSKGWRHEGVEVESSIEDVYGKWKDEDVYVIGGGEIYKQFLPFAEKLEITHIDKDFEGDTYFPEIDNSWIQVFEEGHSSEDFDWSFQTYIKRNL